MMLQNPVESPSAYELISWLYDHFYYQSLTARPLGMLQQIEMPYVFSKQRSLLI